MLCITVVLQLMNNILYNIQDPAEFAAALQSMQLAPDQVRARMNSRPSYYL